MNGVCQPNADDAVCNGDGRCLKGACKPKPPCFPVGGRVGLTDTVGCCSAKGVCDPIGVICECQPHPYDGTTGNACLSDLDCAGGECVGYECRWCSGPNCPPLYRFERSIATYGTESMPFKYPGPMAITPAGNLVVGDMTRVLEFTPTGSLVRTIGTGVSGFGNGQFQSTLSIAVDQDGNIYVGEGTRVQKFTRTGGLSPHLRGGWC